MAHNTNNEGGVKNSHVDRDERRGSAWGLRTDGLGSSPPGGGQEEDTVPADDWAERSRVMFTLFRVGT